MSEKTLENLSRLVDDDETNKTCFSGSSECFDKCSVASSVFSSSDRNFYHWIDGARAS